MALPFSHPLHSGAVQMHPPTPGGAWLAASSHSRLSDEGVADKKSIAVSLPFAITGGGPKSLARMKSLRWCVPVLLLVPTATALTPRHHPRTPQPFLLPSWTGHADPRPCNPLAGSEQVSLAASQLHDGTTPATVRLPPPCQSSLPLALAWLPPLSPLPSHHPPVSSNPATYPTPAGRPSSLPTDQPLLCMTRSRPLGRSARYRQPPKNVRHTQYLSAPYEQDSSNTPRTATRPNPRARPGIARLTFS